MGKLHIDSQAEPLAAAAAFSPPAQELEDVSLPALNEFLRALRRKASMSAPAFLRATWK